MKRLLVSTNCINEKNNIILLFITLKKMGCGSSNDASKETIKGIIYTK